MKKIISPNVAVVIDLLFMAVALFAFASVDAAGKGLAPDTSKMNALIDSLEKYNRLLGSVAVRVDGLPAYTRGFGSTNTTETKFRIGSVTKIFTAAMIFQLIEEGKLSLDTKLSAYYPTVANADKINISHLLGHRSGLFNFTNDTTYFRWHTQPLSHKQFLDRLSAFQPDFEPDAKYVYSNSNYVLLGFIIEQICKRPYAGVLQERIVAKVGLKNTYYGGRISPANNESYSYIYDTSWVKQPETDMSVPGGAGAIVSTPTDLTIFIEALFNKKVVSEQSLAQMKLIKDGYGKGLIVLPFNDKKAYGHDGKIDEFSTMVGYFENEKLAFAICSNGRRFSVNTTLIGILSYCFGSDYQAPSFADVAVPTETLDKYVGSFSSKTMPLKIDVTRRNNVLYAQATGQSEFPLTASSETVFQFYGAGIVIEFTPEGNQFELRQAGYKFTYEKSK